MPIVSEAPRAVSADADAPVPVQLRQVVKSYQSLRPLRIRHLDIKADHALALMGFDAGMAEVFVNLLTAGSLPDEGEVIVFGRATGVITDHQSWMTMLDRFGLISERSVLLDRLTAEQNLAIPFTLAVESMSDEIRETVRHLADEIALPPAHLSRSITELPASSLIRLRLGRALALNPRIVLAEHPNATLSSEEASAFAADLTRIRRARRIATVVITADRRFAHAVATEVLTLQPATGELAPDRSWTRWFQK